MKNIYFSLFMFLILNIYANDNLINEYNILYNDLLNFDTSGYKSSWDIKNNRGSGVINISQGTLSQTRIDTNFAIIREGFFKIRLENDMIGYTRYGDFHMVFDDFKNEFTLRTAKHGYKLYDSIIIPGYTESLKLEGNTLYAFLIDDTIVEVGQVNIYEIDNNKLIRYKDSIFITLDNYNSNITNESRIHTGYVENSNVNVIETLLRMYIIISELNIYGYNYDAINQIILMLIYNIPMINELINIKIELLNVQERLLLDDEKIIIENISQIINEQEIIFPFRRRNPLYDKIMFSELFKDDLLRSSIKFIRIE
jgi:flagellar basal body rod protein FlgG